MPHPHIQIIHSFLFRAGCEGGIAFFRGRLAEGTRGTRNTPRKGPRKGYNVHRFMLEKKTRLRWKLELRAISGFRISWLEAAGRV